MSLSLGESDLRGLAASHATREKDRKIGSRLFAYNLQRELSRAQFFYFFSRNPLKSPDSTKEDQVNPSPFACFYLDLLGTNSRDG
jgi:hypothetical protein